MTSDTGHEDTVIGDRVLQSFDPVLHAALQALPVGWEVPVTMNNLAQQQQQSDAPIPQSTEGQQTTEDDRPKDAIDLAKEQIARFIRDVLADNPFTVPTAVGDAKIFADDEHNSCMFVSGTNAFKVVVSHSRLYRWDWRRIATETAVRLGHTPGEFKYAGSFGEISVCATCDEMMGVLDDDSGVVGGQYTRYCTYSTARNAVPLIDHPQEG